MRSYNIASWDTAVSTRVSNPELTQLTLVDLHPAKTYNLRMFATNSMGMSDASNVLTVTTKEAGTVSYCVLLHRDTELNVKSLMDSHFKVCFPFSTRGSSPGYAAGGPHFSQH